MLAKLLLDELKEKYHIDSYSIIEIVKEIDDKKVELTRGHLEKLRRFKSVDEVAKRWLEEG